MRYRIIYLDAFTRTPFCGNPCAVLPAADGLDEATMQAIARETNLSETAFVLNSTRADVRVRYFMPTGEIPFAGHPTIATAYALAQEGRIRLAGEVTTVRFEFGIGLLPVEIQADGHGRPARVVMTQPAPEFGERLPAGDIAACLGLVADDLVSGLPVQVVSTGVPFLLVPLASLGALRRARMDREPLADLLARVGVTAAYLFCRETEAPANDAHARLQAPANSSEDPFTGSAAGSLAAYAVRHGVIAGNRLRLEQGHHLGRPGLGELEIVGTAADIQGVRLAGAAVRTLEGEIILQ